MIEHYVKKPVVISAIQWTGNNSEEILKFIQGEGNFNGETLCIWTLEGGITASINDFIIRGIKGEFYPCKPDIFVETYEKV